ncbi:inositol monophosphatase family protein [Luteococcus sp. OSA5]|uniref:inositol monophosphatase family protein n=1 Tax=Luteococcus sp. OSA5 TaxID=3401630 RepID=UPI003B42FA12
MSNEPAVHSPSNLSPTALAELESVALEVARACARLVVDERPEALGVAATKSSATDVVTEMDRRSEELASTMLHELRPGDGQYGEEGLRSGSPDGITWVVDPIDGTVNYLYGQASFCVSVAAVIGDPSVPGGWQPLAGAVVAPLLEESFAAYQGGGARRSRRGEETTLRISAAQGLDQCLVGTGFGYSAERRAEQARALAVLLPQVRDIRRAGAAALDLCHVADGQLDAYYERGVHVWDIAAATIICTEAGAVVRGLDAAPGEDMTIAGPAQTANELADLLRDVHR